MNKTTASLDIVSNSHNLSELSAFLQIAPSASSHDKGASRGRGRIWSESILRIDSALSRENPPGDQIQKLLLEYNRLFLVEKLRGIDARTIMNVAVMFESAYVSVKIDPELMAEMARYKIALEVTAYPTEDSKGTEVGAGLSPTAPV
jgi:hypothetical protein